MTQKNLGTSRSVTLRARFQFGTRGAESTTNRRELDDQRIYLSTHNAAEKSYLRARFQFGTRGAECTANRREL